MLQVYTKFGQAAGQAAGQAESIFKTSLEDPETIKSKILLVVK